MFLLVLAICLFHIAFCVLRLLFTTTIYVKLFDLLTIYFIFNNNYYIILNLKLKNLGNTSLLHL